MTQVFTPGKDEAEMPCAVEEGKQVTLTLYAIPDDSYDGDQENSVLAGVTVDIYKFADGDEGGVPAFVARLSQREPIIALVAQGRYLIRRPAMPNAQHDIGVWADGGFIDD